MMRCRVSFRVEPIGTSMTSYIDAAHVLND